MSENEQQPLEQKTAQIQSPTKPNESGQLYLSSFLRISDPETKEVYLETRA